MRFNMYVPTRIVFGSGRLDKLHRQALPGRKALLVTTAGRSVRANGALDRTLEQLAKAGVETAVFDCVGANPTKTAVTQGGAAARESGCDFIVALGGGSVMDAAKAIAIVAANDGDLWDYAGGRTGRSLPLGSAPLPVVCIPTTAGTGSEVDQWGVVTNEATAEKIGIGGSDASFPVLALVDPELTASVPPAFTAYQGFDALFHATECFISSYANVMSDMYAKTSMENIGRYLVRAVRDGSDAEAREGMAFAAMLSGIVMTLSVTTASHSLEHAMSAYHPELPHGAGLIMISKAFYEFFLERNACGERFVQMAVALGFKDASRPEDFIAALTRLQQDCGVAELRMSEYGIRPDEFETIATNARETMGGLFAANPCPMSQEDCVEILRRSYR